MGAKISLNLINFKHLKSDDHTTTLQHKTDGHTITLAHRSLSPESQAQLKALMPVAKEDATPEQADQIKHQASEKMAKGGMPVEQKTPDTGSGMAMYDIGGKVQIPPGSGGERDTSSSGSAFDQMTPEQRKRAAAKTSQQPETEENPTWQKVKQFVGLKAEGGEICHACGGPVHHYDEGGKVPAPRGQTTTPEPPKGEHDIPANVNTPGSLSDVANRLKNAWADGGKVQEEPKHTHIGEVKIPKEQEHEAPKLDYQQLKKEYIEKNRTNFIPGQKRKMYADSPDVVAQNDNAPQSDFNLDLSGINPTGPAPAPPPGIPFGRSEPQMAPTDPEKEMITPIVQKGLEQAKLYAMTPAGMPVPNVMDRPDAVQQTVKTKPIVPSASTQDQGSLTSAAPSMAGVPDATDQAYGMLDKGLKAGLAGNDQLAQAVAAQNNANFKAYEISKAQQDDLQTTYNKHVAENTDEYNNFIKDYQDGHIDPELYWTGDASGHGSHSKLVAGIGMILAGFNPSNKPNAAIDFLKYQMDKNIDAQVQNLNKQHNLVAANLQRFHNIKDATDMSRAMQAGMVATQLAQDAAKSGSKAAMAQAELAKSKLYQDYQPLFMRASMMQTMRNLYSGGSRVPGAVGAGINSLSAIDRESANDLRNKYYAPYDVPGGKSVADRPIPEEVRRELNAQDILDQKGKDILNFVHQHSGTWDPRTRAVAEQKVEEMKNFYNNSIQGGALTQGRLAWYDEQFKKHPTDILAQMLGSTDKLQEMIQSNQARKQMTLDNFGLKPPPGAKSPQVQQANPMEGKTATGPNGQRIIMKNGRWVPAQ